MDFALTALFVVLFLEQWSRRENRPAGVIGIACAAVSLAVVGADNLVIPAMVLILAVLLSGGNGWTIRREGRNWDDTHTDADAGHHPGGSCRDAADPVAALLAVSGEPKTAGGGDLPGAGAAAAMMGLLVVYCLKGVTWLEAPHGAPEIIAVAVVTALHCWKRNVLLSIAGGTAVYMLLVQRIFA